MRRGYPNEKLLTLSLIPLFGVSPIRDTSGNAYDATTSGTISDVTTSYGTYGDCYRATNLRLEIRNYPQVNYINKFRFEIDFIIKKYPSSDMYIIDGFGDNQVRNYGGIRIQAGPNQMFIGIKASDGTPRFLTYGLALFSTSSGYPCSLNHPYRAAIERQNGIMKAALIDADTEKVMNYTIVTNVPTISATRTTYLSIGRRCLAIGGNDAYVANDTFLRNLKLYILD